MVSSKARHGPSDQHKNIRSRSATAHCAYRAGDPDHARTDTRRGRPLSGGFLRGVLHHRSGRVQVKYAVMEKVRAFPLLALVGFCHLHPPLSTFITHVEGYIQSFLYWRCRYDDWDKYYYDGELGCIYENNRCTFRCFAPTADAVSVVLYDQPMGVNGVRSSNHQISAFFWGGGCGISIIFFRVPCFADVTTSLQLELVLELFLTPI